MLSSRVREQIRPTLTKLRLIHFVFLAVPFIYSFVAYQMTATRRAAPTELQLVFVVSLVVVAVICLVGGFVWQRFFFRDDNLLKGCRKTVEMGEVGADIQDEDERRTAIAMNYAQRMYIVSWAFAESVSVYGFVLTIMQGRLETMLPFVAASVLALALLRPRPEEIVERGRQLLMTRGEAG